MIDLSISIFFFPLCVAGSAGSAGRVAATIPLEKACVTRWDPRLRHRE
jgi:hypothetical protein